MQPKMGGDAEARNSFSTLSGPATYIRCFVRIELMSDRDTLFSCQAPTFGIHSRRGIVVARLEFGLCLPAKILG